MSGSRIPAYHQAAQAYGGGNGLAQMCRSDYLYISRSPMDAHLQQEQTMMFAAFSPVA
ncbi:hypothetical protein EYB48_09965 [Undibacterium sp. B2R-29]|nr:hypothetical protein [Undibacterium crateris]